MGSVGDSAYPNPCSPRGGPAGRPIGTVVRPGDGRTTGNGQVGDSTEPPDTLPGIPPDIPRTGHDGHLGSGIRGDTARGTARDADRDADEDADEDAGPGPA